MEDCHNYTDQEVKKLKERIAELEADAIKWETAITKLNGDLIKACKEKGELEAQIKIDNINLEALEAQIPTIAKSENQPIGKSPHAFIINKGEAKLGIEELRDEFKKVLAEKKEERDDITDDEADAGWYERLTGDMDTLDWAISKIEELLKKVETWI